MITVMVVIFILGYALIALEHQIKINKAALALLLGMILWTLYITSAIQLVPAISPEEFKHYVESSGGLVGVPLWEQVLRFVVDVQVIEQVGEICEILIFLIGAMTIVELVDIHGGFAIITNKITTRTKRTLLLFLVSITFFMSAILDNLTTAIVMTMLTRKLVSEKEERWMFVGMIVIAANSGGAWSPIGDVTTIMLWVHGNVTTSALISNLLLPCIVSVSVPLFFVYRSMQGSLAPQVEGDEENEHMFTSLVSKKQRLSILVLGILGLLLVPVLKSVLHLPPFMGVLISLGLIWIYTEIMYAHREDFEQTEKLRVSTALKRIDGSTLLFFLGILLAVGALHSAGILKDVSLWLDEKVHNVYAVNMIIGILSAVIDNVPLVAGSISMYPVVDQYALDTAADPEYLRHFVQDGTFWEFLTYCAGVGGSILIIGSAAGVVAMGLEKISFGWYLKKISWLALIGYLCGAGVYILQRIIFY